MGSNANSSDNSVVNNENLIITISDDNKKGKSIQMKNIMVKKINDNNNQNSCVNTDVNTLDNDNIVKKSSDRNAINFLVLGYFLLVLIISYAYFGSLISDFFINSHNNEEELRLNESKNSTTDSSTSDAKEYKFIKTITSTELIIILWFTIIYGSSLLLFLRFKVLKLERDPNSDKHKKNNSTEDFDAFINNSRNSKQSFKNKNLTQINTITDTSSTPFWQK